MTAPATTTILQAALEAWDCETAPIPVKLDGTKAAALPAGSPYLGRKAIRASREQVEEWFSEPWALGIMCGAVSGGLEMLEVEGIAVREGIWDRWYDLIPSELAERLCAGYLETTPRGGAHLLYRVEGGVPGNTKLARRLNHEVLTEQGKPTIDVLIETRGDGGYVVVAPSPAEAGATDRPWALYSGGFATIPTITAAEREVLVAAARTFDRMPLELERAPQRPLAAHSGTRPGDDYDARHTCGEVLERNGWTWAGCRGDEVRWCRPGKSPREGHSGVEHTDEPNLFVNWSSSVALEVERGYSPFGLVVALEHGGDAAAAARELGRAGYGEKAKRPSAVPEMPQDERVVVVEGMVPDEPSSNGHAPPPPPLPPFPLEVLPPAVQTFVEACCTSVGCTPEMLAPMVLAAAGALVGRARSCGIKEDWQEVPSLWTLAVADPGMRKSPVFRRAMAGPMAVHADLREAYKQEKASWDGLESDEKKASPKPVRRQLIVDDTTIEAIGRVLLTNPRGVVLADDELGGWARGMGQYKAGSNSDRQKWLKLWSHGLLLVNRVSLPEPIEVEDPCVAILGATQPDALPDFLRAGVQDGMLHRFLLSAPTDVLEDPDAPSVDPEVKVSWLTACRRLHRLEGTRPIRLTPDGCGALKEALRDIYATKREASLPVVMRGFWDKADAHLLRLAAALTELWHVTEGYIEEVTADIAEAARSVLLYHLDHARHLVVDRGLLESKDFDKASPGKERELVAWLEGLPNRSGTKRDAMYRGPLQKMTAKEADVVMSTAAARGRVEVRNEDRGRVVLTLRD